MTTRRWMNMLCGPLLRPKVATPFRVTVDGKEWDCATNGKALLLVPDPVYPTRDDAPNPNDVIPDKWAAVERFSYEALREWCCPDRCRLCDGTGWLDRETADDEEPCGQCRAGLLDQFDGFLMGQPLNRRLLWDYMLPVTAASVHVHTLDDESPVLVKAESDSWRIYIMGMVRDRVSSYAPKFPEPPATLADSEQTSTGGIQRD